MLLERGDVVKSRNDIHLVSQNHSLLNLGGGRLMLAVVSGQSDPTSSITIDHALNGEATERKAFQA